MLDHSFLTKYYFGAPREPRRPGRRPPAGLEGGSGTSGTQEEKPLVLEVRRASEVDVTLDDV